MTTEAAVKAWETRRANGWVHPRTLEKQMAEAKVAAALEARATAARKAAATRKAKKKAPARSRKTGRKSRRG